MEEKEKSPLARLLHPENELLMGGKSPTARFLHPENELFIAGKNRFVAQPDEVKHNIMLQVKYGNRSSCLFNIILVAYVSIMIPIGLGLFALGWSLLPGLLDNVPDTLSSLAIMLFFLVLGGLGLLWSLITVYGIGLTVYNYLVYFRPMNVDGLYKLFKRNKITRVQVERLIALDGPYVHICYLFKDNGRNYKGHKISPIEGRYLTTSPINLEVGDSVYIAHIEGADIIL